MFKEITVIDSIEPQANGVVQVRQATRVMRGDTEIAKTYHRWALAPNDDLTGQDDRVKAVCELTWTPEVVKAYADQQAAQLAELDAPPPPNKSKKSAA